GSPQVRDVGHLQLDDRLRAVRPDPVRGPIDVDVVTCSDLTYHAVFRVHRDVHGTVGSGDLRLQRPRCCVGKVARSELLVGIDVRDGDPPGQRRRICKGPYLYLALRQLRNLELVARADDVAVRGLWNEVLRHGHAHG